MKPFSRSFIDLFDGKRRYVIPLFQRQYVWTEEKQLEPLWEDIVAKANARRANRVTRPHFLGAIVLDQKKTYGNEVLAHIVIDGQQRLTTFQVFLVAFRDFANQHGISRYGEEIDRYIQNTGIMANEAVERLKLTPTQAVKTPMRESSTPARLLTSMLLPKPTGSGQA